MICSGSLGATDDYFSSGRWVICHGKRIRETFSRALVCCVERPFSVDGSAYALGAGCIVCTPNKRLMPTVLYGGRVYVLHQTRPTQVRTLVTVLLTMQVTTCMLPRWHLDDQSVRIRKPDFHAVEELVVITEQFASKQQNDIPDSLHSLHDLDHLNLLTTTAIIRMTNTVMIATVTILFVAILQVITC